MPKYKITKPIIKGKVIICQDQRDEVMDPIGYFLIRTYENRLEVGLCSYSKINIIKKIWRGNKPQDIYRTIICTLPKLRKDHAAYLAKELTRAYICLKLGLKYIQDGKFDGTFTEVDFLAKKISP